MLLRSPVSAAMWVVVAAAAVWAWCGAGGVGAASTTAHGGVGARDVGAAMQLLRRSAENGMEISKFLQPIVDKYIEKIKIPDQDIDAKVATVRVSYIKIDQLDVSTNGVKLKISKDGIEATMKNARLLASADFNIPVSLLGGSGNLYVDVRGLSLSVHIKQGKNKAGKPVWIAKSCKVTVDTVKIKFSGGGMMGGIANMAKSKIGSLVRKKILESKMICSKITDMIKNLDISKLIG